MDTGIEEKYKQKIMALVAALLPQAKIYLFGSRARGKYAAQSDIDIALDAGTQLPNLAVAEVKDVLAGAHIPYTIDVVDLYHIPEKMRLSIVEEGILWKISS